MMTMQEIIRILFLLESLYDSSLLKRYSRLNLFISIMPSFSSMMIEYTIYTKYFIRDDRVLHA